MKFARLGSITVVWALVSSLSGVPAMANADHHDVYSFNRGSGPWGHLRIAHRPASFPGDLDPAFGNGGVVTTDFGLNNTDIANAVAIQDDGKIVVVGRADGPSGANEFATARFNPDGSLDSSFDGDGRVTTDVGVYTDYATAVAIQSDGKIVVAGNATFNSDSTIDVGVVRYASDGSLDQGFGSGGIYLTGWGGFAIDQAFAVSTQTDGKIVIAGAIADGTYNRFLVIRLNSDGTPDTTFGPKGRRVTALSDNDDYAFALAILDDGKIVVAGSTETTFDVNDSAVVRYMSNGALDTTFDGDGIAIHSLVEGSDGARAVVILPDGNILLGESCESGGPPTGDQCMLKYKPDGTLDPTFGSGGAAITDLGAVETTFGMAVQPDGKILLAGTYFGSGYVEFLVARYLPDGSIDQLFGGTDGWSANSFGQHSYAYGIALQPDGNIVLAGYATPSSTDFTVARYVGGDLQPSGLPADFNGDGYGDLAVGVPWEDNGTTDAGAINVLYGSATGLTSTGNQFFDEVGAGFSSYGFADGFGYSSMSGDFNGDGFADLAASAPGRTVGSSLYAGTVGVLYGSPSGLSKTGSQQWTQDSPDIQDVAEANDFFGWTVATGDLNGDGFADLAVGVPGETVDTKAYAGGVNVIYGSSAGLVSNGNQFWSQNSTDINGKSETDDEFGLSLAIGDFSGDGFGDLAVGAPLENLTNGDDGGSVNAIYGSAAGLTATGDQLWDQDSTDINDKVEKADYFGYALGAGDFDADGFDDLVAGVPAENLTNGSDAGAANVIYGTSAGLSAAGDQFWNQDKDGINDTVEKGDEFGAAVSAGDFNGDGYDDAVFGIPWEDIGSIVDGGAISVIYGTSVGLDDPNDDYWRQNSSGIEDTSETADLFGYSVVAGNFGNGPEDDVAVGVPLEGVNVSYQGAVNVIYGSATDLTDLGDQFWNQDSTDILDQGDYDDEFGFGMGEPGTGGAAPTRTPSLRFLPIR